MSPSRSPNRTRISLASGAGTQDPLGGLVVALVLHAIIIAATFFTFIHRLDITSENIPIVPVDLVTLADKTNVTPAVTIKPPKVEPDQPTAQTQPEQFVPPPPLPKEEPAPAPKPLAKPQPPAPPKQSPQVDQKQSLSDSFTAMINHYASASPTKTKTAPQMRTGAGAQTAMTADIETMLFNEIRRCWNPPVGAPDAKDIIVAYDVFLNPDGTVAQPPQLDARSQAAKNGGDYYVAAADLAAQRAIRECAPYKLPPDRYQQWREINPLIFDPSQMMGQ